MDSPKPSFIRRQWLPITAGAVVVLLGAAKLSVRSVATGDAVLPGVSGAPILGPGPDPTATPGIPRARLRVQVTDIAGSPVPQALVEVRDRFNAVAGTQQTGESGEALLSLPAGAGYTVTVRKEGFQPGTSGPLELQRALAPATSATGSATTATTASPPAVASPVRLPPQLVQVKLETLAQNARNAGVRLVLGHASSPRVGIVDPVAGVLLRTSDALGSGRLTYVTASPDAHQVYASWPGTSEVLVLSLDDAGLAVDQRLPIDGGLVTALAVYAGNGHLWVATNQSEFPDSAVLTELDPTTWAVKQRVAIGRPTSGMRFTANGATLFARHRSTTGLSVVDVATGTVLRTVALPQWPVDMAISPDESLLFVVAVGSDKLAEVDVTTGAIVGTIEVGAGASSIAVHPDGRRLFVVNQMLGSVQIVDRTTRQVTDLIPVGRTPQSITYSASTRLVYVANAGSGSISVIDPDLRTVRQTLTVGGTPSTLVLVEPNASA